VEGTLSLFDWRPAPVVVLPEPRLVIFDCETTGIDFGRDQIIELCVQHGLANEATTRTWRIKPAVPIQAAAQAVHGIAMEDLEGCPPFVACADDIVAVFADAEVIVGYNIAFDIDMLQAELARAGKPPLDLVGKQVVDALRLWQQCEPRSLTHAHRRFVGEEFAAAHSASADVAATGRVLLGMLRAFGLADDRGCRDWGEIANVCDPLRRSWVGPSRHLRWDGSTTKPGIVLGFGKYAGAAMHELAAGPDRSFLRWMIDRPSDRGFPAHVVEICRAALDMPGDDFLTWARDKWPPR
jgi:DNA polymerase-3 subunit epsilon